MKKLNLFIVGLGFLFASFFYSCKNGNAGADKNSDTTIVNLEKKMDTLESAKTDSISGNKGTKKLGKEYTSRYICPDHCKGSGSDKPGKCADCGMDLIENPSFAGK
jgi:hypothetical protein